MKRSTILTIALSSGALMAHAQFNIGIKGGVVNPGKSVSDSLSVLRSGYNINVEPSYNFGKFSLNSSLGYQSFNTKSGFEAMAKQHNYTADKGFNIHSNSPGFYNAALGAGFNLLPSGITGCGVNKPSLIISSQFGILKPVNPTDAKVSIDQKATLYSIKQNNKALPYFNAGADVICPLNNLIAIKSGVSYNQTTSDMQFQQSSNGNTSAIQVAYSNVQFTIGIQFSFKGITEKGIKRSAAAKTTNPLYNGNTNTGNNPLNESKTTQPGQPVGGVVAKSDINQIEVNPLYNGTSGSTASPIFEGSAETMGNPIGGIIVKGGKNPGGNLIVLNNGKPVTEKGISEKGVKKNDFAIKENGIKSMSSPDGQAPQQNAFAIKENGIKVTEAADKNDFAIKENGIKKLDAPNTNKKGIQEKGMKTQAMIYTSDFSVEDPMLLSYLGTSQLIIKKGEYAFDYSKNPNGDLKLKLSNKIIHRDLAARNLTFVGFNPETKSHFEYTIEPEYVNGVADHIVVSYKSISEKGIK